MANEPRKPQIVPLAKIHDLPGVFIPKVQDKASAFGTNRGAMFRTRP